MHVYKFSVLFLTDDQMVDFWNTNEAEDETLIFCTMGDKLNSCKFC